MKDVSALKMKTMVALTASGSSGGTSGMVTLMVTLTLETRFIRSTCELLIDIWNY